MTSLRLALIINYPLDPERIAGGVQAVAVRLVEALRRAGELEVHVVHCHSDVAESRVIRRGPVTVHYMGQTRQRLVPNMMTGVARIAARLRQIRPDVVHAHGPSFAVAAHRAGYQPLWTIHGVVRAEARHYRGAFNYLSFRLALAYEQKALAETRIASAISPYIIKTYERLSTARWHLIENPAPAENFALSRQPVPGSVLSPMAVIPLKDPLSLEAAAALMREATPDLMVRIAGPLPDTGYAAEVRRAIASGGLDGHVSLMGDLSSPALRQELVKAAVVCLPSRQEVAPMAVIEAMAAGVPAVATSAGGLPYLVEHGVTGLLVPPEAPSELAGALTAVLNDNTLAQSMGAAGRTSALERFQPDVVAAKYIELYKEIADHVA